METTEQTLVGSRFQRLEAREDHHGLLGPKTDQPAHPDGMPGPPTFNNNNNNRLVPCPKCMEIVCGVHHGHLGTVHLLQVIKTMMKIVVSLNNVALASKQVGDFF